MRRVVLLVLLALPSMALATTLDKVSLSDDRSESARTVFDRPAEGLTSGTSLFTGVFHGREMSRPTSETTHFVPRDSYMVRVFSKHEDCDTDKDDNCDTSVVPEPGSLSLVALGLIGIVGTVRRKLMS